MPQKSSTIALFNSGKVLLLKRGSSAPWQPNKYCLVGGGVDNGETLEDAALREANEEIGINLNKESLLPYTIAYSNTYTKIVFASIVTNIHIQLNYEHSEYGWFDYKSCVRMYKQKLLVPRLMKTLSTFHDSNILV